MKLSQTATALLALASTSSALETLADTVPKIDPKAYAALTAHNNKTLVSTSLNEPNAWRPNCHHITANELRLRAPNFPQSWLNSNYSTDDIFEMMRRQVCSGICAVLPGIPREMQTISDWNSLCVVTVRINRFYEFYFSKAKALDEKTCLAYGEAIHDQCWWNDRFVGATSNAVSGSVDVRRGDWEGPMVIEGVQSVTAPLVPHDPYGVGFASLKTPQFVCRWNKNKENTWGLLISGQDYSKEAAEALAKTMEVGAYQRHEGEDICGRETTWFTKSPDNPQGWNEFRFWDGETQQWEFHWHASKDKLWETDCFEKKIERHFGLSYDTFNCIEKGGWETLPQYNDIGFREHNHWPYPIFTW